MRKDDIKTGNPASQARGIAPARDVRLLQLGMGTLSSFVFPVFAGFSLCYPKWRKALSERCVGGDWGSLAEPAGARTNRLWFHGASVGEFTGIRPVLQRLKSLGLNYEVVTTSMTSTGKDHVRQSKLSVCSAHLPYDHPLFLSKVIRRIQPQAFVLAETELWPSLFLMLASKNIPIVIFNGRISDYSWPGYRRLRSIFRPVLKLVSLCMVQTPQDAERFEYLGVGREAIRVVGSTKYDFSPKVLKPDEREQLLAEFGLTDDAPIFVAGSVRPGEDAQVLEAYLAAREENPELQMIVAPRHKEKFESVARSLERFKLDFNYRSRGAAKEKKQVLLLDTYGDLNRAYAVASIAFVGATLVDIGGHNPFEPASFKVPVVVGPYTRNVKHEVEQLIAAGGLFQIDGVLTLTAVLRELCSRVELRKRAGDAAFEVWQRNLGATERVVSELLEVIEAGQAR